MNLNSAPTSNADGKADAVVVDQLRDAFDADESTLTRGRHDLAERATAEGLLDLAYRVIETPIGSLMLVASPAGLVRVAFDREGHDTVLGTLAGQISPRILQADRPLESVAQQLDEYFHGRRRHFDISIDLALADGFRRQVLTHLRDIPYGATRSYRDVAAAAGSPHAVRAVGSACSHNPLPVIVPCHRVVRSDGSEGGYLGGADAKRILLSLEAA